jgi:hypothetical protein
MLLPIKAQVVLGLLHWICQILEWIELLILALTHPRGLWHRGIYLFQVELALDGRLIDAWDHVGRLDEGHAETRPHQDRESRFRLLSCKVHLNRLELTA